MKLNIQTMEFISMKKIFQETSNECDCKMGRIYHKYVYKLIKPNPWLLCN